MYAFDSTEHGGGDAMFLFAAPSGGILMMKEFAQKSFDKEERA